MQESEVEVFFWVVTERVRVKKNRDGFHRATRYRLRPSGLVSYAGETISGKLNKIRATFAGRGMSVYPGRNPEYPFSIEVWL